jgi:two-component system, NarL family, invasion response regulator UvrY
MIGILLCDDHRVVRAGIRQMLSDAPEMQVVAEANTGEEAIDLVRAHRDELNVALLDIALPGRDGLDVLQTLKREHPTLAVLMLSTYPEKQYAVRCIKLGASGYLNKAADPDDMLAAVRKAAAGGVYVSATTAEALATSLTSKSGAEALSHREHQVFRLLTLGHSVSEIGAHLQLAPNTVSTYRARILEKTGTKNDVELALWAQQQLTSGTQRRDL